MLSLTQPELLLKPFAESGDKNTIPSTNTDAQNPQLADLTNGFPPITSEDPSDGGLPPERKDLNGLGYLTTTYDYFYQAGGRFTFSPTISSAIGGYPLNAALWYTDSNGNSTLLRSTVANNTNNFNNGNFTGWQQEIPVLGWSNTWTGTNTFVSNIEKKATYTLGVTPSQTEYTQYRIVDANGTVIANIEHKYKNSGDVYAALSCRKQDGSATYGYFGVGFDSSGNVSVDAQAGVKQSIVSWGMPDMSNKTSVTQNTIYQATSNGWIVMYADPRWDGNAQIRVGTNSTLSDGVIMFLTGGSYYDNEHEQGAGTVPIAKGNYYKVDGVRIQWAYFIPCIGG